MVLKVEEVVVLMEPEGLGEALLAEARFFCGKM